MREARLPRVCAATSVFHRKDSRIDKGCFSRSVANATVIFHGLERFADFERGNFDGTMYVDTIFLKPKQSNNENMYFHELVHVIQWRLLGPDRFLLLYANGLECFGYRQSPLEAMAYDAESAFASSAAIFNAEKMVAEKLGL